MKFIQFAFLSGAFSMKTCNNCKHFIANKIECGKFSEVNLVSGKITYESASYVRADEEKCGKEGVFFEKNNYKIITVPYYFIKDYTFMITYLGFFLVYAYLTIKDTLK